MWACRPPSLKFDASHKMQSEEIGTREKESIAYNFQDISEKIF